MLIVLLVLLGTVGFTIVLFISLGIYLHLTSTNSHPTSKKDVISKMDCKEMSDRTDENIWSLIEGLASIEECSKVESHIKDCFACVEQYGTRVQALKAADPLRYNTLYSEMINVKKAKLLRKARNLGLEVNLAPIKDLYSLYRIALVVNLNSEEQHLISIWDNASEEDKAKMIITFTQRFNLF